MQLYCGSLCYYWVDITIYASSYTSYWNVSFLLLPVLFRTCASWESTNTVYFLFLSNFIQYTGFILEIVCVLFHTVAVTLQDDNWLMME